MRVRDLVRYPVKSMRGERLDRVDVHEHGLEQDRCAAVVDLDTGTVLSGKREPRLVLASSRIEGDEIVVALPGGNERTVGDPKLDADLAAMLGRRVAVLRRDALPDARYESNVDHLAEELELKLSSCPVPTRFHDAVPVHVLTDASIRQMQRLAPGSRWAPERFRANVVVSTEDEGFVEETWVRRSVRIGSVELRVLVAMPRCAFTTRAVDDLPADREILRALARLNEVKLGVACDVIRTGEIRAGDEIVQC